MKWIIKKGKEIILGHIGICILLICIIPFIFISHRIFGGSEESPIPAELETKNLIVVGFSQLGSESGWRTAHTMSVQNSLTKDAGYFLIFSNARQMQENQIKAIRSFISQRVDYIVFAPVIEDGWDTVLQEAKDAEIPVIIIDRMVSVQDDSLYTTWIGADTLDEGRKAGKWLEKYVEDKNKLSDTINIVVLQGTIGSTAEIGRTKGFEEIAAQHDNWHILTSVTGEFTANKGKEVMQKILQCYSDIDVLVSQNDDMTMGAIEAMQEAGISFGEDGKVAVISFDATKDALEKVKEGKINVDIECNPIQGKYIDMIIRKLERKEPVNKNYFVEENVFTKDNVGDYLDGRIY